MVSTTTTTINNDNDSMRCDFGTESGPGLKQKEQKEGLREQPEVNDDEGEIEGEEEEEGDDNDDDDNEDDEDDDVEDVSDDDVESDEGDEDVPNGSDANDEESVALIVALGGMGKCLVALQRCSRDIQVGDLVVGVVILTTTTLR